MEKKELRKRNIYFSIFVFVLFIAGYFYAETHNKNRNIFIEGKTFGVVPYSVKYVDPAKRIFQRGIDSVLNKVNDTLSTYLPQSQISQFNASTSGLAVKPGMFREMVVQSAHWNKVTRAAFNPTIKPLVNLWGFGAGRLPTGDTTLLPEVLPIVDYSLIRWTADSVVKDNPAVTLDFGAIAKGYGVDLVAQFLESKGIKDYMIEVGGEVRCSGTNPSGEVWRIGIDNPLQEYDNKRLAASLSLKNRSIATSGNYRNFYEKDGKRYAHIIDPKTGFPVSHSLLSASVITKSCTKADALATALMVLGTKGAIELQESQRDFEMLLIYDQDGETRLYISNGLKDELLYNKYQ